MRWRLGLDIGTNSIGWWAFRIKQDGSRKSWRPVESLDGGSYIFPDGREPAGGGRVGDSLAVTRRLARSMRRNRDRGKRRIHSFVKELIRLGLLPEDKEVRDKLFQTPKGVTPETDPFNPYRLRAEAIDRPLNKYELGRALLHLGLRRGYKSNRKEASDEDHGKLKKGIDKLNKHLGNQTLGQYLWNSYLEQCKNKNRKGGLSGIRFRDNEDVYPERIMYEMEFNAIREAQEGSHDLSRADWDQILEKHILFQRPLKEVERGFCEFLRDERRHWQDTPIGHDFRIYQELNNLMLRDEKNETHQLDEEQREAVLALLLKQKTEVKFAAMRKKKRADGSPLFPKNSTFNLEDPERKRTGLKPHRLAAWVQGDPLLKDLWDTRQKKGDKGRLDDIFDVLHKAEDNKKALKNLAEMGVNEDVAKQLCDITLASGTSRVSRKFMGKIVPVLRDKRRIYSDAVNEITDDDGHPLHHSLRDDGERWEKLPYYGEVMPGAMLGNNPKADPDTKPEEHFGKINNPTVHVALNSLRRVINELIDRFGGSPLEIHIELTRELKLSKERREEINVKQAANRRENKRIKKFCAELGIDEPSARDIKKVKLWEELGKDSFARRCVYSGKVISAGKLFNGEAEIEHILPFSRTLDNSMSNLTLSMRWANSLKDKDTPYEAFSSDVHSGKGIVWEEVLNRAKNLPKAKRRRFGSTAMERFDEESGGFISRQLNDTAYITRIAQRYLKALDGVDQDRVVANPGHLTAIIRGKWGLNNILGTENTKTRDDHRHHAVDAAVVGLIDRGVLNKISRETVRETDDRVHIKTPKLEKSLQTAISERVPKIITAFKLNHGAQGRMFNDTAYGFVLKDKRDPYLPKHDLVARKPLKDLTPDQCEVIRDPNLRHAVLKRLKRDEGNGIKHKDALANFVKETGVKRVRVLDMDGSVRWIQTAAPYKGYSVSEAQALFRDGCPIAAPHKGYSVSSYACLDLWRLPLDKNAKNPKPKWKGVPWTFADCRGKMPDKMAKQPHPAAKFVARLFKGDIIAYEEDFGTVVKRVTSFFVNTQQVVLRNLEDATDLKEGKNQPAVNTLCAKGLRRLFITPDGRILTRRQGDG